MKIFRFLLTLALSWSLFGQEIVVVHAFDGFLNEKFIEIVEEFNRQSQTTHVTLKQAKNYKVAYEEGIKSHKEGQGPHILQVYEVATLSMMLDEGRFVPVGDLL